MGVQLGIQMVVGVGQLLVYNVTQGATWSSVHINLQDGEVATQLSLHSKLDVRMYTTEVVKEIIQFFVP
jgi:hypothetical protein